MPRPLHIVDVFAREPYAGNQSAVVTDASDLPTDEMQAVAAEMGYSETTFVTGRPEDGAWPVRIFTPNAEIPFAGHPTLGTAAEALDRDWPVQVVSIGLPTIVVPLRDREALTAIDLDRTAYDRVTGDRDAKNVLAFCPDPREADDDLAVRVFAPFYDVPEDPATGSSNGCLAAYLAREEYFGGPTVDARVEQGFEMGRPSLLGLRAGATGGTVNVEVGGSVVPVVRGELL